MTVQIYISFLAVYDDNSFKNKLPVDIVTVVIKQHKTSIQMKKYHIFIFIFAIGTLGRQYFYCTYGLCLHVSQHFSEHAKRAWRI